MGNISELYVVDSDDGIEGVFCTFGEAEDYYNELVELSTDKALEEDGFDPDEVDQRILDGESISIGYEGDLYKIIRVSEGELYTTRTNQTYDFYDLINLVEW